jgi:hypothetical protein
MMSDVFVLDQCRYLYDLLPRCRSLDANSRFGFNCRFVFTWI